MKWDFSRNNLLPYSGRCGSGLNSGQVNIWNLRDLNLLHLITLIPWNYNQT